MALTCYIGPDGSGSSCTTQPIHIGPGVNSWKAGVRCGVTGGKISDVEYEMLGQVDEGDRYRIVRRFPADDPSPQVKTKEVVFSGKRSIIFQDDFHCIVIDSPKK